jgi:hypothetical protein
MRQELNIVGTAVDRKRGGRIAMAKTGPNHYLAARSSAP